MRPPWIAIIIASECSDANLKDDRRERQYVCSFVQCSSSTAHILIPHLFMPLPLPLLYVAIDNRLAALERLDEREGVVSTWTPDILAAASRITRWILHTHTHARAIL